MPPDTRVFHDQLSAMYAPRPLVGQSSELPQRLSEVFQLHYETALSGPGASRRSKQSLSGLPARSSTSLTLASPSEHPLSAGNLGSSHRPSPLPALSSPLALGHVSHIAGSGLMPGTHVWASCNASQSQGASPSSSAPLNFPQFRVRSVLSTDSGSPQAEHQHPQQVPSSLKRPAAAPLPVQRPKKRGRPSRKDKAEAAAAAAAAAAAVAASSPRDPQDRLRKLPHILPKASWSAHQVDCATESAAVMVRQHKAKQLSAGSAGFPSQHAFTAPPGMNIFSGVHSVPGLSRETSLGRRFGLPTAPSSIQGASSASCIADARSEQLHATAAANMMAPVMGSTRDIPGGSIKEGNLYRSSSRISGTSDGRAAAPSPKSVPALDWLMDKLKSQAASRTAASALRSCQEQADESNPAGMASHRLSSSRLGFPRIGSSSSLQQLSSGGAPSSSRQSRPPASVVAAASELLARHGGMDSRLERLPTVSSVKGSVFAASSLPQFVALADIVPPHAEAKGEAVAPELATALFPVQEQSDESGENAEKPELDLDLHL